jgi:hypothetical protein
MVERGDEMHLRRAGIGETDIDPAVEERADKAFGAVYSGHAGIPLAGLKKPAVGPGSAEFARAWRPFAV